MMEHKTQATVFFAVLAILARVLFYVTTPVWIDFFNPTTNRTSNQSTDSISVSESFQNGTRHINIIFLVVAQWSFSCLVFAATLVAILVISPGRITDNDRRYPKKNFFIIGFAQGISSLMINFAISGKRTAPYLQALLSNFGIPIQFLMRFLVLRQAPTCLKTICASAVVASEFVCLLPTIFPNLESTSQRHQDGGASGPGAILWPILMVMSMVPYAFANTIMEKSVQNDTGRRSSMSHNDTSTSGPVLDNSESRSEVDVTKVNLVYFLFWWTFFNSITVLCFFWIDLIPGFGTSSDINEFLQTILFNVQCIVGQAGCGLEVASLGWLNFIGNLLGALAFAGLMRFSEGASFVVIVLALRTPIVFLFWTLFLESPFKWHPHVALSTWLSIGAIFVMFPAVIIYNTGLPSFLRCSPNDDDEDDQPLTGSSGNVNTENSDEEILIFRK